MKKVFICLVTLFFVFNSCKENVNSENVDSKETGIFYGLNGNSTIEGFVGYFSPGTSPFGYHSIGSGGYMLSDFVWLSDTPSCSFSAVYLEGKEDQLAKAVYVRAKGEWIEENIVTEKEECHYLKLVVDSLQIILGKK